ncbi:hypothetical protein ACUH9Y_05775 [Dermabacteraceae bacterium P13115]
MKLTIKSEPISNYGKAQSRIFEGEATEAEIQTFIDNDLRLRSEVAEDPGSVQPRSAQEILVEIGKEEYNAWHTLWRQDRNSNLLCSYDVWNAHGNQDHRSTPSIEDQLVDDERKRRLAALSEFVTDLIDQLPDVQRAVAVAVLVQQRPAFEVAAERGVSQAAISKTLAKAKSTLKEVLLESGVNYSGRSGLPTRAQSRPHPAAGR